MARKAAVVIGVDKTGNLAVLQSAAAGAEAVADWLRGEGYDVECLTDKSKPVRARDIEDAIAKFVTLPPQYAMLVVYFSGHGYWHARSDLWLLSGAPVKTSEAINLDGAMDLARYSGIPNVVFISDACRSIPDSRDRAEMKGIDAFPNYAQIDRTSKVDVFKATSEAHSAYEGDIEGERQSIMTYALISAYKEPEPDMIREVMDGATKVLVVPNRKIENYLQNKINDILADIDVNLTQNIEACVPSGDDVFIARAHALARRLSVGVTRGLNGAPAASPQVCNPSVSETLRASMDSAGSLAALASAIQGKAAAAPTTVARLEARLPSDIVDHFESQAGFVVQGARVVEAISTKGQNNAWAELLDMGNAGDRSAIIRLWDVQTAVSIAVRLEDGRCAILAGLAGYIGHASFDKAGLSNISYIPSSNHGRWQIYSEKKTQIDRLRAAIALAVEDNAFRIRSDAEAKKFAETIRMDKSVDPTLGLYAAHAFAQAGQEDGVMDVMKYMRMDLAVDLFDVRVLASRRLKTAWNDYPLVPFCPMLTQTWNLLRPRGITLPGVVQKAISSLCDSLWTTFHPEITEEIMQAIKQGELK
jgi:hypothetical protein